MAKSDFTIIFTGKTGSGKSQAGNFILNTEAFQSAWSFNPVTESPASCTSNVGDKRITVIDTPGMLDPSSLTSLEEFTGLAKAIIDMPNGVNAVALVINLQDRISKPDQELLEKVLALEDMIPYTFIIFTHANVLGKTRKDQQKRIEAALKNPKETPDILRNVLSKTNNRYIVLESVEQMERGYYEDRFHNFLEILQGIWDQRQTLYTCELNDIRQNLKMFDDTHKDELIKQLTIDLQTVQKELKEKQIDDPRTFWKTAAWYIAGGLGFGVGAGMVIELGIMVTPALVAGASQVFQYISKHPEIFKEIFKAIPKVIEKL